MSLQQRAERLAEQSGNPELLQRAWALACEAHGQQRRRSGEAFVSHPLAVAEILAGEGLAAPTLAAALLHDTLEDSDLSIETLRQQMGGEIAQLVDGVTKIRRAAPRGSQARAQAETYRKLILAAVDDARVLVLKLADRLHNARTLAALPPQRQEQIARETLQVYVPLAMRLGMASFREELEDLAFAILEPQSWQEAELVRREQSRRRASDLEEMRQQLARELEGRQIEAQISTRVKSRYSVAQKLRRTGGEIYDILGLRVIVPSVDACYLALGAAHLLYVPRFDRLRDYIARPKSNSYQSLHTTVIGPAGQPVEIQIRTPAMHQAAEHGLAAHWLYKEQLSDGGPETTRRWIVQLAEHTGQAHDNLLDSLRAEVFRDEIWVFTPKGQVHVLPAGATPVDLAYAVHTELGHSAVGARVNGHLVDLSTPLHAGDVVEIRRGTPAQPRREWLEFVVSSRARSRLRSYFAAQAEPELAQVGQQLLDQELSAAGLEPLSHEDALRRWLGELGFEDFERGLAEAARPGRARQLVERLVRRLAAQRPLDSVTWQTAEGLGVTVAGRNDLWVRPAGCCQPLPGEPIRAYVALGGGSVIHRAGCRQLAARRSGERIRLQPAAWATSQSGQLRAQVSLVARDRMGLLHQLADAAYGAGLEIEDVVLHTRRGLIRGSLMLRLVHRSQLDQLVGELAELDGMLSVQAAP